MNILTSLKQTFHVVARGVWKPKVVAICFVAAMSFLSLVHSPSTHCFARAQTTAPSAPTVPVSSTQDSDSQTNESSNPELSRSDITVAREQADELISQLGSAEYLVRESAQEQLVEIGPLIRDKLERQAVEHSDRETVLRIGKILKQLLPPNMKILDAVGNPIPFAKTHIVVVGTKAQPFPVPLGKQQPDPIKERIEIDSYSDATGGVAIPDFETGNVEIVVEADGYGSGLIAFSVFDKTVSNLTREFRLPLVPSNSEAAKRGLVGTVKDSDEKPIAGATVNCLTVRTPGAGLINHLQPRTELLTNADGSFRLYMPCKPDDQRGELIPANSNYRVIVSMPGDSKNVPVSGIFNNAKPANIVFSLKNRIHRLAFETLNGKPPTALQLKTHFGVQYRGIDGKQPPAPVDLSAATKDGVGLAPGIYSGWTLLEGQVINLTSIELKKSSPEELLFKFPPSIAYRGRVVDCSTQEPIPNALVFGYSATGNGSLAMLSDSQWDSIAGKSPDEILQSPFMEKLRKIYQVQGLTISNADGRFSLLPKKGEEYYGVIACAPNHVPYAISNHYFVPKNAKPSVVTGKINSRLMDFPLVPAGKILLHPISDKRLSVAPNWIIEDEDQPQWIGNFKEAAKTRNGEFKFKDWLAINEPQQFFVPAELKLKIQLGSPYDQYTAPFTYPEIISLKPGEELDIGKVEFEAALQAVVRVVDEAGTPIEGLPVRLHYHWTNSWSVAHNTDKKGEARFGLNPNSSGKFGVGNVGRRDKTKSIVTTFNVADSSPTKPFVFKLSQAQIDAASNVQLPPGLRAN